MVVLEQNGHNLLLSGHSIIIYENQYPYAIYICNMSLYLFRYKFLPFLKEFLFLETIKESVFKPLAN